MKHRFVDIHHHLAYGVDDGPKNARDMQKMLRHAAKEGIGAIIATPHVTPGVQPFYEESYRKALASAREYCRESGLEIEIYEGCEVLYTEQTPRMLREGRVPTLAGTDYVLVEFSPDVRYSKLREALERISCEGFIPVVAHCERYECLVWRPSRVRSLRSELGAHFQINCSSIVRNKGFLLRRFVRIMLEEELADALGTDAHNVTSRPANMKAAWRIIRNKYGSAYARRLTDGSLLFSED